MTNKDKDVVIAPVGATIPTITSILQNSVPTGAVYAGGLPAGSAISKKPCYLLSIELKPKATYYFISLDKTVHENYFQFCQQIHDLRESHGTPGTVCRDPYPPELYTPPLWTGCVYC